MIRFCIPVTVTAERVTQRHPALSGLRRARVAQPARLRMEMLGMRPDDEVVAQVLACPRPSPNH